jgi:hypothetical protein
MQIAMALMNGLRDSDPAEFNRLCRSNQIDAWWRARAKKAREIYEQLTAYAEKDSEGMVKDRALHQAAEEQAIAAVMEDLRDGPRQLPKAATMSSKKAPLK